MNTPKGRLTQVDEFKVEIKDHFVNRFKEPWGLRLELGGVKFKRLSSANCALLEEHFSVEEIKETVWSCEGDKSLGPDGFNMFFSKLVRTLLKMI